MLYRLVFLFFHPYESWIYGGLVVCKRKDAKNPRRPDYGVAMKALSCEVKDVVLKFPQGEEALWCTSLATVLNTMIFAEDGQCHNSCCSNVHGEWEGVVLAVLYTKPNAHSNWRGVTGAGLPGAASCGEGEGQNIAATADGHTTTTGSMAAIAAPSITTSHGIEVPCYASANVPVS